jgi:hypothetical protein
VSGRYALQVSSKSLHGGINPSCGIVREDARKTNRGLVELRQASFKTRSETVQGSKGTELRNAGEIQFQEVDYVTIVGAD